MSTEKRDIPVPADTKDVAGDRGPRINEDNRIPMSVPQQRLEVDESRFPEHRLYWFLGANTQRALQAGYEFVHDEDVSLNQRGVGTSSSISGNADMGTRVSVVAGEGRDGRPEYLYLMKIKREWFLGDQKALEDRNNAIMSAIRAKKPIVEDGESRNDLANRYVRQSELSQPFQSKRRP